jgi:hypothetical protein
MVFLLFYQAVRQNRHTAEGRYPLLLFNKQWIPACAGMTACGAMDPGLCRGDANRWFAYD